MRRSGGRGITTRLSVMMAAAVAALAGCSTPTDTALPSEAARTATAPPESAAGTEAEPKAVASSMEHPFADAHVGQPRCEPASPVLSRQGLVESRLTSNGIEGWALLWARPPWSTGDEVKVVWRVSGSGDLDAIGIGPDGQELSPSWGPNRHTGSSWDRPGDEWGLAFKLNAPGCWEIRVTRSEGSASLWVDVGQAGG